MLKLNFPFCRTSTHNKSGGGSKLVSLLGFELFLCLWERVWALGSAGGLCLCTWLPLPWSVTPHGVPVLSTCCSCAFHMLSCAFHMLLSSRTLS
ncbi:hypothetical protein F5050DRAFT_1317427 [Lentinula boryana]|uniref:Uncharacterized protein n=1 Tax=Lentinula boryana TaxID=40481 RepID=A0ABQ8PXD7_9AGAR|nr:hypothetical protein F5050DRAFT_1317427 [Lentinula boryana]